MCSIAECRSPSPTKEYLDTHYTRNRSTTRSWPVIYRNPTAQQSFIETSKQEQLQKYQKKRHYSTHQYDFDQMYGLNNTTYNNYLACSQNFEEELKSPSLYDMQQQNQTNINQHQHNIPAQTQTSTSICSAPPPIIFLFFTLLMTSSATAMLCSAIMSGEFFGYSLESIIL